MTVSTMQMLILASTSVYRRELLARLRLPFECARPEVDESVLPAETPTEVALRLSVAKGPRPSPRDNLAPW